MHFPLTQRKKHSIRWPKFEIALCQHFLFSHKFHVGYVYLKGDSNRCKSLFIFKNNQWNTSFGTFHSFTRPDQQFTRPKCWRKLALINEHKLPSTKQKRSNGRLINHSCHCFMDIDLTFRQWNVTQIYLIYMKWIPIWESLILIHIPKLQHSVKLHIVFVKSTMITRINVRIE